MEPFEQRPVIKYLQKKVMSPPQIHQDMVGALGESTVSYFIIKSSVECLNVGEYHVKINMVSAPRELSQHQKTSIKCMI
ncbi:hypothetical protein ANN_27127 [Periplaneta americana]|uniref:Uncharacterized protein n=1 Tax=Periplaneta americana TaxID=6978 RepID=A0ABQ8RX58_PERAM|nr:hypothetical protein ANN_27127 [Periplaneta americana]